MVGIDHIPELVDFAVSNLKKDGLTAQLENGSIVMVAGDGRKGRCQAANGRSSRKSLMLHSPPCRL